MNSAESTRNHSESILSPDHRLLFSSLTQLTSSTGTPPANGLVGCGGTGGAWGVEEKGKGPVRAVLHVSEGGCGGAEHVINTGPARGACTGCGQRLLKIGVCLKICGLFFKTLIRTTSVLCWDQVTILNDWWSAEYHKSGRGRL